MFLPLSLVYATQVVGLPVAQAGVAMTVGTMAGLVVPAVSAAIVDRVGARAVVVAGQLVQLAGSVTYLLAHGVVLVAVGAAMRSAGLQLFYSSMFTLITEVAGDRSTDRTFTVVGAVRGAAFGIGALAVGALLTGLGPTAYTLAIGIDATTYVVAAVLLLCWLPTPAPRRAAMDAATREVRPRASRVLRDPPYLGLIVVTTLFALDTDFFLVGFPVYAFDILHTPAWVPGAALALLTALGSAAATLALRMTRRLSRTTAMVFAAVIVVGWCLAGAAALVLPAGVRPAYLLGCTLLLVAANLVRAGRVNALAESAAPPEAKGRYLAAFQYAFTIAGVLAPAVVALFAVAAWLPWMVIAAGAVLGIPLLHWITRHLHTGCAEPRPA
ncbi:MFS transporter [Amycolatopsis sp. CA-230715]|uniref:MFS transporter n=1 Tax=Amycolatopsis sp. CA-230715 TaxID=2745196 RepID=UPI003FA4D24F